MINQLESYFAGRLRKFTIPLALEGTIFQLSVWHALKTIPYGRTASYGTIAKKIGNPNASRAVGAPTDKILFRLLCPVIASLDKMGILLAMAEVCGLKKLCWIWSAVVPSLKRQERFRVDQKSNCFRDWTWREMGVAIFRWLQNVFGPVYDECPQHSGIRFP